MASKKVRLITVHNLDWITPLKMYGPIVSARYFSEDLVKKLVYAGYDVKEYPTPVDKATVKSIKLTTANFDDRNRFNPDKKDMSTEALNNAITGTPIDGTAKAVSQLTPDMPVDTGKAVETTTQASPVNIIPNGLSKNERKRLARQQREAEAVAKAAKAAEEAARAEAEATEQTATETAPEETQEAAEATTEQVEATE